MAHPEAKEIWWAESQFAMPDAEPVTEYTTFTETRYANVEECTTSVSRLANGTCTSSPHSPSQWAACISSPIPMDCDGVNCTPNPSSSVPTDPVNVNCTSSDAIHEASCNNSVFYDGKEVSIRCWNIDGRLATNLTKPEFLADLEKYDINFFQETHLYPSQEETLPLPDGYDVFAVAHEPSPQFSKQQGGVAAIFRRSLPVELDQELSGPDLLVLNIGIVSLFCAYILPTRSPWTAWAAVHPWQKLQESLAISHERGDMILVIGDLNGRTGARRVLDSHPSRFTLDTTVNQRGLDILSMGRDFDLRIINGDSTFSGCSWGWTYYQKRDGKICKSVIEYAMCSVLASSMVKSFDVCPFGPWSDHVPIILNLAIPIIPPVQNPRLPYIRERRQAAVESNGYLDCLLRDVFAAEQSPEHKRNSFYGPVYEVSSNAVKVYTDGSCLKNGNAGARAGAGTYGGPRSTLNASIRVSGEQTNNRGELLAILYTLSTVRPDRSLDIYSDSEYAIRSIVYWAPERAQLGWKCVNADLLQDIVSWIKYRSAPVQFNHVKAHSGNSHNDAADCAANAGAHLPLPSEDYIPCGAPDVPLNVGPILHEQKVFSNLPEFPEPKDAGMEESASLEPCHYAPHRGRALNRALQRANLKRLTDVSSNSAAFWKVYRELVSPRKKPPTVQLPDLASCFEKRMNAPEPPPKAFNMRFKQAAEDRARAIPTPSVNQSSDRTFDRMVTEDDIAWAKDHLKSHSRTAAGMDRVHYDKIINIENNVLCRIINECIEHNDVPVVWLTTLIAAIPKRGKPLSEVNSYRTVGLESCFLKLICLLIQKRIYDWAEAKGIIPPSQNGFREKYRTNNNAFVLRCMIERARAEGRTLWVAFLDITHAQGEPLLLQTSIHPQGQDVV